MRGRARSPMRSPIRARCSNATRTRCGRRRLRAGFPVARAACVRRSDARSAIAAIRCCDRYCRWSTERDSAAGYSLDPLEEAAATLAPGRDPEVSRPRPVDCCAGVRGALPLLFPSRLSVLGPPTGGGVSVADRGGARSEHLRSDSVRRRSADAEGRAAAPTHRAARCHSARTSRPHPHAPAGGDSRTGNESSCVQLLRDARASTSIVLHVNHPNEIAGSFVDALAALHRSGVALLNQSVLLAGVNDDARVARRNCRSGCSTTTCCLITCICPIACAARIISTSRKQRGLELIAALRSRLPGYLVPRLVREVAGLDAKQIIAST